MTDDQNPEASVADLENKSQTTKNVILGVIDEIKNELKRAQDENAQLKAQLEDAKQSMSQKDKELSDLSSRFAALGAEIDKNRDLEKEIEAMRLQNTAVEEAKSALSAELSAIEKERDDALATLKSRDAEISRLQETCNSFEEIQQALQSARSSTRG